MAQTKVILRKTYKSLATVWMADHGMVRTENVLSLTSTPGEHFLSMGRSRPPSSHTK